MYNRRNQNFGGSNSQYDDDNDDYGGFQKSSWRAGGYDESPPRGLGGSHGGGGGGNGGLRSSGGGRDFGSSRGRSPGLSRGQGRGSGSSRGRGGGSGGYSQGSGGGSRGGGGGGGSGYGRGSGSGSGGQRSSSGGGPNRGYSTGTGDWGANSGSRNSNSGSTAHAISLLSRAKEIGLTGEWNSAMSRGANDDRVMNSSGNWNMNNEPTGNFSNESMPGEWHSASDRNFAAGSSGGRDHSMSAVVNEMNSGNWNMNPTRGLGSGASRDRETRQTGDWDVGSSRGRGTSGRGRDRNTSGDRDRDSGRSSGWLSGPSRGRGAAGSSRGRDMMPSGRETRPSKGFGARGAGYSSNRDMDSGGSRGGMGTSGRYDLSSDRGGMSGRGGFEREPREAESITEKAMDILKAVLGPTGYNADNLVQDFPPSKRRRTEYEGEEDDYRRGPQARSNRGRGENRWGSSSFDERFNEESDGNRWGPQSKRLDRDQEEKRWGPQSRSTRHNEDHDENQWGSQSHNEHFGRNFNEERWGPKSQNRNKNDFQFDQESRENWREGGRNQNQWGSQSRNEREVREQKMSRWGSQSQSKYHEDEEDHRWEPESFNEDFDDENDHSRWDSRSYGDSDKRRKPLLGPYPDFEKPKPKSLLGAYPEPEKMRPKPKPLLGPYPGHDKPKPKPLLGPYPGHDRPKPKSLLGPYPGLKERGGDDYEWEPSTSSRGAMRSRGMRRGVRSSRGRGTRERRYVESFEQENIGYEEPQPLMQSYDEEYNEEPFSARDQLLEYQEGGGWFDDSEWGPFEQYEEGDEEYWPGSSFGDPQSWQFDELAWQYGDQQGQEYYLQAGGYQPQRLSVRERLGAKKPGLLGAAPSVDLVKQLLTPQERKRLCEKYGSLPLEALYCHMCNQSKFSSIDSYLMHQIGKKHVAMTRSFHAKSNTTYQLLKADVQLALKRDRFVANVATDGYCPTCDVPKWGNDHHMSISANLLLHRFVKPVCCNQRFSSRLQYENHRLSLKHLQNEHKKKEASEGRFKKKLADLKGDLKREGMEDEVEKIEKEEERIASVETVSERIKELWKIMVPKMNLLAKEKLPEKILNLKIAREINLRTKKSIKNSVQFVPFDPAEQVGVGSMIISTHYRCSICSKSIEPNKENIIEHCTSEDHYNNAVRKGEEMKEAKRLKEEEAKAKEEAEANKGDEDEKAGSDNENEEDLVDDEPMEDPYEGESGDINTLMNEVEEMIDNEDDQDEEKDEKLAEGFEDGDELIYDDGDIAEEFRDVLDYNPDDMEEELSYEEAAEGRKATGKSAATGRGAARRGKAAPKKEKTVAKASPVRRTRRK